MTPPSTPFMTSPMSSPMTSAGPATAVAAPPLRRVSHTFSADGRRAACLATPGDGTWHVESWTLASGPDDGLPVPALVGARPERLHTQLLALDAGHGVLMCRHEPGRHDLVLVGAGDQDPAGAEEHITTLRTPGLRVLPYPGPDGLALALGTDTRPVTTVWLVHRDRDAVPIAELPGLFGGGVWLDTDGRRLALDAVRDGHVKSAVLDLSDGTLHPFLEMAQTSNDRLHLCDPRGGLLVVGSDAPGHDRLGWIRLPRDPAGPAGQVRFPEAVNLPDTVVRPLAVAPDGERVALQLEHGARTRLAVWTPERGTIEEIGVPPGSLGGVGRWTTAGLHVPFSAPDLPGGLAVIVPDGIPGPHWALAGSAPATAFAGEDEKENEAGNEHGIHAPVRGPGAAPAFPAATAVPGTPISPAVPIAPTTPTTPTTPMTAMTATSASGGSRPGPAAWHPAHLEVLAGAEGPMEAVVYGGPGWRGAEHLVVALHGGPAAAWRFEFDPLLQRLARGQLAIVAPNQRGSTGYGAAFADALHGAWGGPDLADITTLGRALAAERAAAGLAAPAVFGTSYGAYLALLCASTAPDAWSRCVAVAPFLSGPRLIAEASLPVRALMTRLGGDGELDDEIGPRDVLRLCEFITAPLLVVHGDRDETIPVGQSRTLRHRLLQLGRAEGTDFTLLELPGAGHAVLSGDGAPALHRRLVTFLRTGLA